MKTNEVGWPALIEEEIKNSLVSKALIIELEVTADMLGQINIIWPATISTTDIRRNSVRLLKKLKHKSHQLQRSLESFNLSMSPEYVVARSKLPAGHPNPPFAELIDALQKTITQIEAPIAELSPPQKGGRPKNERIRTCIRIIGDRFETRVPGIPRSHSKKSLFYKVVDRMLADAKIPIGDLQKAIEGVYGAD